MDEDTRSAIGQLGHEMRAGFERMDRYFDPVPAAANGPLDRPENRQWTIDRARRGKVSGTAAGASTPNNKIGETIERILATRGVTAGIQP